MADPRNGVFLCVFFCVFKDVSTRGLPRPAHCSRAVWRSLRGPPGWCSSVRARSAPIGASANVTPGSSRSRMRTAPSQDFPRFCLSFPLLGNPNPPGRQGCMWPHYFTLALHGITDDWGECRRLESTAEGEFWCGEQTPPRTPKLCFFVCIIFVVTMSVRSTYSVGRANVVVKRYQYARYQRPRTTAMLSSIPGGPSVCEGGVKSKAESPSPALIRFIASPPRLLTQPAPYLGCPPYASHGRHVNVQ